MKKLSATLTIKKKFLDAIISGEKTKEYRKDSLYYRAKFDRDVTHLRLHYQAGIMYELRVKAVKFIKTPKRFDKIGTMKCWEISLDNSSIVRVS